VAIEVSFCVVNTDGGKLLVRCLDAIAAERAALAFETEVLVLDNASTDGSAERTRAHPAGAEVVALDERRGKAANDSALLQRARGTYALLLNEDSELRPGATAALHAALEARPDAALGGARPLPPDGGDAEEVLAAFNEAGMDTDELALRLQKEGAETFVKSWNELLETIEDKVKAVA